MHGKLEACCFFSKNFALIKCWEPFAARDFLLRVWKNPDEFRRQFIRATHAIPFDCGRKRRCASALWQRPHPIP